MCNSLFNAELFNVMEGFFRPLSKVFVFSSVTFSRSFDARGHRILSIRGFFDPSFMKGDMRCLFHRAKYLPNYSLGSDRIVVYLDYTELSQKAPALPSGAVRSFSSFFDSVHSIALPMLLASSALALCWCFIGFISIIR